MSVWSGRARCAVGVALGLVLLAVGCQRKQAPRAALLRPVVSGMTSTLRSVCPGCEWELPQPGCFPLPEERIAIGRDQMTHLGVPMSHVLAFVEGEHRLPLRWETEPGTKGASGFLRETTLTLSIAATRVVHVRTAALPTGHIELEADIGLSTSDGALAGVMKGVRIPVLSPKLVMVSASRALSLFMGKLELEVDRRARRQGVFQLNLSLAPGRVHGSLNPYVSYRPVPDDENAPWQTVGLRGKLPDDGCSGGLRVGPDDRPSILEGRSVGEVFEQAKAEVERRNPLPGTWGKESVRVFLEPGEPTSTCMSESPFSAAFEVGFAFDSVVRVHTSNGRIDVRERASFMASLDRPDRLHGVSVRFEGPEVKAAEFGERTGFSGVEFGTLGCGRMSFHGLYELTGLRTGISGVVEATGFPCGDPTSGLTLEHLRWCRAQGCRYLNSPSYPPRDDMAL